MRVRGVATFAAVAAAAIVAGTEMLAGLIVPRVRRLFARRTHALIAASLVGVACLALIGHARAFAARRG